MLIDFHVHSCKMRLVTQLDGGRFPTPEELLEMFDERGIDKGVLLPLSSPEWRYTYVDPEEILEFCRQWPDRSIPFFNLDPRMLRNAPTTDFRPMMQTYKDAGFKGIGEYVPNLPFDDPLNMNVFRQTEEMELPLIFHIGPTIGGCYGCYDELGLPRLEKVLKACPKLILCGHSQPFWAEISADVTQEARNTYPKGKVAPGRVVELMREYPNLHGDLSASSGWNAVARDPEFGYAFLEEFQDRLYWGTDICRPPEAGEQTPLVGFFQEIREKRLISDDAYEKITWRNADRLLGLGLA